MLEQLRDHAHTIVAKRHVGKLIAICRRLLSEPAEANSFAVARNVVREIEALDATSLPHFFDVLAKEFNPSPDDVLEAALRYKEDTNAQNLVHLMRVAEPQRQELFRRINRAPDGTRTLVRLRRRLLESKSDQRRWAAVEADLFHLFSSWFSPGFLEMRTVNWNSQAHVLEQVIQHEAVHAIDGWDDLRRRLQPDRRCFAFFHPQLAGTPLIFVEVALLAEMPSEIAPLLDKRAVVGAEKSFKVAVFYSISNCEPGLRGVSLGNFLIKRVAQALQDEMPQIKKFCTLSPIPTLRRWLVDAANGGDWFGMPTQMQRRCEAHVATLQNSFGDQLEGLGQAERVSALGKAEAASLSALAAAYLIYSARKENGDPVARFHLDNGARLERINVHANLAAAGIKQSAGTMVNYLYDLDKVEDQRKSFVAGKVVFARGVVKDL